MTDNTKYLIVETENGLCKEDNDKLVKAAESARSLSTTVLFAGIDELANKRETPHPKKDEVL